MEYRIVNGTIIDGSGAPAFRGELRIKNSRISAVIKQTNASGQGQPGLEPGDDSNLRGKRASNSLHTIDATGCYITPGFIDAHSHADLGPYCPEKLELKLRQGVTTEVVGQCGFSPAPMPFEQQSRWQKYYVPGSPIDSWPWETTEQYFSALRHQGLPLNFMPFVGHGTVRFAIKGDSSAHLDPHELDRMEQMLEQSFREGAAGLSFGLIYVPALFARREELLRAARTAARFDRLIAVHMRSESDELIEAIEEVAAIGRETGAHVHISHLKTIGNRNQSKIEHALNLIEKHGLSFDNYPYTYGSTSLLSMLPPQLFEGRSVQQALTQLCDAGTRREVKDLIQKENGAPAGLPWDNLAQLVGWDKIELVYVPEGPDHYLQGLSLSKAAEKNKLSPADLTLQLVEKYGGTIRIIDEFSTEETLRKIICHPSGIASSDTLLGGQLHPRVAGSFARYISRYSTINGGPLGLEAVVHRMTGKSAEILGLKDRGVLVPDSAADIAVWRPGFTDLSIRHAPEKPARGLDWLFLNGEIVIGRQSEKSAPSVHTPVNKKQAGLILSAPTYT